MNRWPDFGKQTVVYTDPLGYSVEGSSRYTVPNYTFSDLMRIFHAERDKGNEWSGNPSNWPDNRGMIAVLDVIFEELDRYGCFDSMRPSVREEERSVPRLRSDNRGDSFVEEHGRKPTYLHNGKAEVDRSLAPLCDPPCEHTLVNKDIMWGDGDVICTRCSGFIREWDSG